MKLIKSIVQTFKHKGAISVLALSFVSSVSLVPLLFSGDAINEYKVDVYLFSDKVRYPENIAYDISEIVSIIIFTLTIWRLVPSVPYKRYVFCFLISAILSAVGYFLFYSQYVSLFLVPMLIILIGIVYFINRNEERNNVR